MGDRGAILIVDDNADLVEVLAEVLAMGGYVAQTALGGREALRLLGEGARPDAIAIDVKMPQLGGLELLARMRESPALADVPVLFFTGDDELPGVPAGVPVLLKPFDPEDFLAAIDRLLATRP